MKALLLVLLAAKAAPPAVNLPDDVAVFSAGADVAAGNNAGRAEADLHEALKQRGVSLVDIGSKFPASAPPSLEEGEKLFAQGREAYDNLDFDAASKALSDAAIFFIKQAAHVAPEKVAEVFLFYGASELQNGKKPEASKQFARALLINPELAPDTKYFGADVLALFNAAKKEVAARGKGKVSIEPLPSGVRVEIAGKEVGLSPVKDHPLAEGRHHVRLLKPGFEPNGAFPDVKANETISVSPKMQPVPAYGSQRDKAERLINRANFDGKRIPLAATDVGTALKSRYLVMVLVNTGALGLEGELQTWDLNSGNRLKDVKFPLTDEGYTKAAQSIDSWLKGAGAVAEVAAVEEDETSSGGPVYKQWWFWAAVGGAAVVAGVTTGVVVASQPRNTGGFNVILAQP